MKIIMVVAHKYFQDEEYFIPKAILQRAGFDIKTASDKQGVAIGVYGGEAEIDLLVKDIGNDFNALVLAGGGGCLVFDNEEFYQILRKTFNQGKLIASICISPIILAKAGILKGVKSTVWYSLMDKSPIKTLKEHGAIFEDGPVVIDNNIITANGPLEARKFGEAIVQTLTKK